MDFKNLKIEYLELLSKNDLEKAYDFWTTRLDYIIDFGSQQEINQAEIMCDSIYSVIKSL